MAQDNLKVIVIGGGAGGISAASTAKGLLPDASVTLFTEYEDVAYSPCGIPFVLGKEIPNFDNLFLQTSEHYAKIGIDLRLQTKVTGINIEDRTVSVGSEAFGWDRLVIATGFEYDEPDIPGIDLDRIKYIKNIRRAMEFDKELESLKKAVVVCATPLGIEMAGNLAHRGLETHLVDEGGWLMSEIADPDIMEPVRESLEEMGAQMHFGTKVLEFKGTDGKVTSVVTSNGEIECDVVVIAAHKKPNNSLSSEAGIDLGATGGIVVDDHMRTSVKDVFAAGDCTEIVHGVTEIPIQGLSGSHAYSQGRVAGANAAGDDRAYDPVFIPWGMVGGQVQIGGVSLGETLHKALGIPHVVAFAMGISRARYYPGVMRIRVKLIADPSTRKVLGAQMSGGEGIKERADFLAFVIKRGVTLDELAWMENVYSPPIGALMEPIALAAQAGLRELAK
ncbi:MAG: FAD-dependent oxidoreductase [Candidatus Dadabacteria bacterium]|nr:FAD-dependent oxidoreductase [Candidatus Dadabacteria bacterium]